MATANPIRTAGKNALHTLRWRVPVTRWGPEIPKILARRGRWNQLVIHDRKFRGMPPFISVPLLCGQVKGRLTCPPELTILLIHN